MESAVLEALVTGGPVAILAGIIFVMYVRHRNNSEKCQRDDRVFMEDRLTKIIDAEQKTREENTKALTELNVLLKTMNGRSHST